MFVWMFDERRNLKTNSLDGHFMEFDLNRDEYELIKDKSVADDDMILFGKLVTIGFELIFGKVEE